MPGPADEGAGPRVGVDLACLAHPASPGVRRAALELWRALAGLDAAPDARAPRFVPLAATRGGSPRRWRQVTLPRLSRALRLDGLHATVSALPLAARTPLLPNLRIVQTVHEVPWRTGEHAENADRRHRAWARTTRADATIVPSAATARALAAERGSDAGIHRVPWGVGAPFTTIERSDDSRDGPRDGAPVLVVVGGTRPKKRLDRALLALAACERARDHALVVTGPTGAPERAHLERCVDLARRLGVGERLRFVGAVGDARLARLLATSDAHLVVSASEGFGLGALEAAATGTPSVVQAGGAAHEAAGALGASDTVATFTDGDDAAGVARAIDAALAFDADARDALRTAARACTWTRTAERVARLWCTLTP